MGTLLQGPLEVSQGRREQVAASTHVAVRKPLPCVGISWPHRASMVTHTVKNPPTMQEVQVQSLGQKEPLEKGMATYSSIPAWRIPWTEEPGGLQFMVSQRVGCDWATNTQHRHSVNICGVFSPSNWRVSTYKADDQYSSVGFRGQTEHWDAWAMAWERTEWKSCPELSILATQHCKLLSTLSLTAELLVLTAWELLSEVTAASWSPGHHTQAWFGHKFHWVKLFRELETQDRQAKIRMVTLGPQGLWKAWPDGRQDSHWGAEVRG